MRLSERPEGRVPPAALAAAARLVRGGGVVVYPSDTVYGLGGDARRPDVAARCRSLKGRGAVPMLSLVDDWARVAGWVDPVEHARCRAVAAVSGVTVLAAATPGAPPHLVGAEGWIGVRLAQGVARELVAQSGAPLLSTSANPSGAPTPTRIADLAPALRRGADAVVDGGELGGPPSTVVRPEADRLVLVREGVVLADVLRERLGLPVARRTPG